MIRAFREPAAMVRHQTEQRPSCGRARSDAAWECPNDAAKEIGRSRMVACCDMHDRLPKSILEIVGLSVCRLVRREQLADK
jgi:hypothetical protein